MNEINGYKLGWLRDFADVRDYHLDHEKVQPFLLKCTAFGDTGGDAKVLPARYDIAEHFHVPAVKDQKQLGSCTANAAAAQLETYACVAGFEDRPLARKFLYKVTRKLMGETGDTGAYLRTVMQAMATFGVPPESYCPYDIRTFDEEPAAFLYSMAQNDKALTYYRLDPPGTDLQKVVTSMKVNLAANRALILGFTVYSNLGDNGDVPLPGPSSSIQGGHAIELNGYDDARRIGASVGAFRFPNSWNTGWGDSGYGWLPYDYVLKGLATDIWALMSASWLNLEVFR